MDLPNLLASKSTAIAETLHGFELLSGRARARIAGRRRQHYIYYYDHFLEKVF